jgi:hypothetical protein
MSGSAFARVSTLGARGPTARFINAIVEQAMAGVVPQNERGHTVGRSLAAAVLSGFCVALLAPPAPAETSVFQQALNYVFTGQIDPQNGPEIVDQKSCVIVLRDPKYDRYIRYYLSRFRMDDASYDKKYAGSRVYYELDVKGDDVVIEYLNVDKKTVLQGYRSAQIPLPGDIDQTRKALGIIFADHCKAEKPKVPF